MGCFSSAIDAHAERPIQAQRRIAHQPGDIAGGFGGGNAGQVGLGRFHAGGVNRLCVHIGGIEIAQLAFFRRRRGFCQQALGNRLQPVVILLVQFQIDAAIGAFGGMTACFAQPPLP